MKYEFTPEDIKNEINKVYLEDEDVLLEIDYIEDFDGHAEDEECDCNEHEHYAQSSDNERLFKIVSKAEIDGERYHDFETVFAIDKNTDISTAADLMNTAWLWYDWLL